jgi:hypothetical protein
LMIGLTAPGALLPILVILTALGGFTVLQRAASAWRQLDPERAAGATPQNGVTKTGGRVDRLKGGGI